MVKSVSAEPVAEQLNYRQLTRRNTLFTLLLFIAPFILLLIFMNFSLSGIIKRQAFNQLAMTVEENTKIISLFLQDKEIDFRSYRRAEIDSLTEVQRLWAQMEQAVKNKPWYEIFFIANLEGKIILSTDKRILDQSVLTRPYFISARQGHFFNSGIFYSDLLQQPALVFSQPLYNRQEEIIGVLGASIKLAHFYNLIFDLRLGETSELFLVDAAGLLL